MTDEITIEGLKTNCVIGTLPRERNKKQTLLIDISFSVSIKKAVQNDDLSYAVDYKSLAAAAAKFVSKSRFYLIETLAERLSEMLLAKFFLKKITLRISKPQAIRRARSVSVKITRAAK